MIAPATVTPTATIWSPCGATSARGSDRAAASTTEVTARPSGGGLERLRPGPDIVEERRQRGERLAGLADRHRHDHERQADDRREEDAVDEQDRRRRVRCGAAPRSQSTIGWRPAARMTATNIRTSTGPAAQANPSTPTTSATPIASAAPRARSRARDRSSDHGFGFGVGAGSAAGPPPPPGGPPPWPADPTAALRRRLGLRLGARPVDRAAPRVLVPEVGGPRVEPAGDAGAAPRPGHPARDVGVPRGSGPARPSAGRRASRRRPGRRAARRGRSRASRRAASRR